MATLCDAGGTDRGFFHSRISNRRLHDVRTGASCLGEARGPLCSLNHIQRGSKTMKSLLKIALLASMLALAACGGADCNNSDVKQSLLELIAGDTSGTENAVASMFGGGSSSAAQEAFANGQITGVTTLSKDEDTGSYLCRANVAIEIPTNGKVVSSDVTYQVAQIESDDADFEVQANQSDVTQLRFAVNGPINQELRKQAEAKRKSDVAAAFKSNPPIAVTDEEATATIVQALHEMPGGFDPAQFVLYPVDLNGDGYKEFVALWRDVSNTVDYSSSLGSESQDGERRPYHDWKTKTFRQNAREPGQKAELQYSLEDYDRFDGNHPINAHEFKGNILTVSDGTGWSETREFSGVPISQALYE